MPAFGRIHAEDTRDRLFLLERPALVTRTFRYWMPKRILDQGPEPSCVGYAWASLIEGSPVRMLLPGGTGSLIYKEAQLLDEFPGEAYDGTSVRGGAKAVQARGRLVSYGWAFDLATAVDWILTGGPLVVGTNWYESMMNTDGDGFIEPYGSVVGGHAYIMDGASVTRGVARFRNSWGVGWGRNGSFFMTFESLSRLISEDGEACTPVEV